MKTFEFKDREPQYPGRKKLTIVSQTADTMIADVEYADEPIDAGTAINAEIMEEFQQGIIDANTKSDQAVTTATEANIKSNTAVETSNTANTKADSAVSVSNEAKTMATNTQNSLEELEQQVIEKQGTKVSVNGQFVTAFDADTKVDKTTYETTINSVNTKAQQLESSINAVETKSQTNESSINAVANRVSALEAQPIITKVTYDATANKFTTGASLQVNGIYLS